MKGNSVKLLYNNLVSNPKESSYKFQAKDNITHANYKNLCTPKRYGDTFSNSDLKTKFNQIVTQVSNSNQIDSMSQSGRDLLDQIHNDENFILEIKMQRMQPSFLPPKLEKHKGMKTLFVDLDETLVHSSFIPIDNPNYILPVEIEGKVFEIYVLKRPGVKEFLEAVEHYFEVIIYTASLSKYAGPLLNLLDEDKKATHRLFREQCVYNNVTNGFVKDLECVGRDLKDVIIIDNSPGAYLLQPENGIPIQTWIDDKKDYNLLQIIPVLELLSKVDDTRNYIRKIVKNNSINIPLALNILKKEVRNFPGDKRLLTKNEKFSEEEFNANFSNINQRDYSLDHNMININNRGTGDKEKGMLNLKSQNLNINFQNRYLQNISQPNSTKNLINLYSNNLSSTIKSNEKLPEKICTENMNNNENYKGHSTTRKNILQTDSSKIGNKNLANFKKSSVQNTPTKNKGTGNKLEQYIIPQTYINNMVNDSLNNLFHQKSNKKSAFERYKQKVQNGSTSHHISNTKVPFSLRIDDNGEKDNTVQTTKPTFLKTSNSGAPFQKRTSSSHSMSKKIIKECDDSKGNSFNYIKQTPKQTKEKSTRYNSTSKILSANSSSKKPKVTPSKLSMQNATKFERPCTDYPYSNAISQSRLLNSEMNQSGSKQIYSKEIQLDSFSKIGLGLKWPNLSGGKNFGFEKFISKH